MSSPAAIYHMNEYKGSGVPHAMIPVIGIVLGLMIPYGLYTFLEKNQNDSGTSSSSSSSSLLSDEAMRVDNLFKVLQVMVLPGILFFMEFIFGTMARSKSIKAGFSPAAIQASGNQPFEIIEANRIHQNHIESACIYIPMALSTVGAGVNANATNATAATWVIGRFLYRFGYQQHHNPMWRLLGLEISLTQSFICFGLFVYAMYQGK